MLIATQRKENINDLKNLLKRKIEMKDFGVAKKIFRIEIHHDRGIEICHDRKDGKLWLSKKAYMEKILQKFSMMNVKPMSTPLMAHFKLSTNLSPNTKDEVEYMVQVPYASETRCLVYLMICTKPDISQAVSIVCRYKKPR